jgi:hypothetical protein
MDYEILYSRGEYPYGRSWETWTAVWSKWLFSIPKNKNPGLDKTGQFGSEKQSDKRVWFLAGTFGNQKAVKRRLTIPSGRSILFPILVKEDSFAEDHDLKTAEELIIRSKKATDRVQVLEATINGKKLKNLQRDRKSTRLNSSHNR